jgi:photosystem II stability/assembly factor-like uncharacterized protein
MRATWKRWTMAIAIAGAAACAEPYTWGNVRLEGGGFVDGIVPSRTQPGLVYARTDVGGAYRWDSTGGRWIPLMDWLSEAYGPLYGTEAIALDPHDSKRLYILCGIHYNAAGKSMILRSADYGATFDTVNIAAKFKAHGNGMGRQSGEKLAVDPNNGAILLCGTRLSGLWKSADTGKTWAQLSRIGAASDTNFSNLVNNNGISFVLFDSASGTTGGATRRIFVGVSKTNSSDSNLFVSEDAGATWSAASGGPAQMAMRASMGGRNLYVTFSAGPGPFNQNGGNVYRYPIVGKAWTKITPKTDSGFYYASGHEGYAYAFGGISVDPSHPARVIVSTISCYGGNNSWPDGRSNAGDIFFLSSDSGTTWNVLNPWGAATPTDDPNGNAWISGGNIHWAGSLEFDRFDPKKVWVGSGNGVFRTDDVGAAVPSWKFQSKGIEETVPMQAVSFPNGPLVTAVMDYDGSTYDDILTSYPLHKWPVGTSNSLGYSLKTGIVIRSGRVTFYGGDSAGSHDLLLYSADTGHTWTMTDTAVLPGSSGMLAVSADGRTLMLRPNSNSVRSGFSGSTFYRSTNAGKSWTASTGLSTSTGILVADPVNAANFYTVPDGYTGTVYGSTDTGKTFAQLGSLVANNQYSASSGMLRANPYTAGDLWICLDAEQTWNASGYSSNGLAHSTDGGKTWTRLNTMTACLTMGLGKPATTGGYPALYMWGVANGGPRGIYRSIDTGKTWARINDDQHQYGGPANGNFVVGDLNVYGRVYMSTAGRGLVYGQPAGATGIQVAPRRASDLRRLGQAVLAESADGIRLCDLRGRSVRSSESVAGRSRLDLSGLPRGMYVARSGNSSLLVDLSR